MSTIILSCCKHEYQNAKYHGGTVHNMTKSGEYRCTVCNKSKSKGGLVTKKIKK